MDAVLAVSKVEVTVRLRQEVQKFAKKLHSVASVMLSHTSTYADTGYVYAI